MNIDISNRKIAVIAGHGDLPQAVISALKKKDVDFTVVRFSGLVESSFEELNCIKATFEDIAELFATLRRDGYDSVVCCGYVPRPTLDLNQIKQGSREILEPILSSFINGDEAVFSAILNLFAEIKLEAISIKEIIPELFVDHEFLTLVRPSESDVVDSNRAQKILEVISAADLGQGVVVRNGLCIAVETSLGTDEMLKSLFDFKGSARKNSKAGVLYKAPKSNQNPFLDHPVIGEETVQRVKKAGLNGIVIQHSNVIVMQPKKTVALANKLGIFIWSKR